MKFSRAKLFSVLVLAVGLGLLGWAFHGEFRWVAESESWGGVSWRRVPLWQTKKPLPTDLLLPLSLSQDEGAKLSARMLVDFDPDQEPLDVAGALWGSVEMVGDLEKEVGPTAGTERLESANQWLASRFPGVKVRDLQYRLSEQMSWRSSALQAQSHLPLGRVVVVGLDGLEPRILLKGIKEGTLPNFALLFQTGSGGTATPLKPIISPILWTTMATGTMPEEHGILDFYVQEGDKKWPVANYHRKKPAVWNAAAMADRDVTLHGWWASDPMDSDVQNGLSDKAIGPLYYQPGRYGSGAVRGYRNQELEAFQAQAEGFLASQGLPVWSQPKAADFSNRQQAIAATYTSTEVAWRALEDRLAKALPGSLLLHYVEGTDILAHLCMAFRPPALPDTSLEDRETYGNQIDLFYQYLDRRLGGLIRSLDPADILFLVTDHGIKSGADKPHQGGDSMFGSQAERWHTDRAQWLIWTRNGRHQNIVKVPEDPFVGDFRDTVLAMLGLPHGDRSWWQGEHRQDFDYASLWQPGTRPENPDEAANAQALENLVQLGYISSEAITPAPASNETDTALLNRGIMALEKGDTGQAEKLFHQALVINPNSYSAHHNLMGLALRQKRWPEARDFFLAAQLNNPEKQVTEWSDFLLLLAKEKKGELVIDVGQKGLQLYPDDFVLMQLLGTALAQSGSCSEALPIFERALIVRPDAYATMNNAALCASQLGEKEKAKAWLEKSLKQNPDQPQVKEFLARL